MRRCCLFVFLFVMLSGCVSSHVGQTHIYFPFTADQITQIEMYHYVEDPSLAEKKIVTQKEDIQYVYDLLQRVNLEEHREKADIDAEVTSFRFCLSGALVGESFELVYYGYCVKDGIIYLPDNDVYYFTEADIGWNWSELSEDYIAVPAPKDELP